jgi:hypothetical protein
MRAASSGRPLRMAAIAQREASSDAAFECPGSFAMLAHYTAKAGFSAAG